MRYVLLGLLGLSACTGPKPEKEKAAPAEAVPEAKAEAVEAKVEAKVEPVAAKVEPAPPPELPKEHALVLADGKLLRVAPSGATETIVDAPGSKWCDVDDDHRVVWLVSPKKVSAYDPHDAAVHEVAKGFATPPEPDWNFAWQVRYWSPKDPEPTQSAGRGDGLDHCVALTITVGAKPTVAGEIISEGDRDWYCFTEDTIAEEEDRELDEDNAPIDRGYDKAKLVDPAWLMALAERRETDGPRPRPEPTPPSAPKPRVDESRCEEGGCGEVEYIGGSRLWSVVVSNARGDFFHQNLALYDSKTKQYWDPLTDKRTKAVPEGTEEWAMHASPDGTWGIYGDKILALDEAKAVGTVAGSFCGWE